MKELNSIKLAENVNLHILKCDIFKTTSICVFIPTELDENYTYHALIPSILCRGTKSHPDQKSIEILMQDLYGANFSSSVKKFGNKQVISFSMDFIDEQYTVLKENLFDHAVDFLHELIFEPTTRDGLFLQEYVMQESFNLKQQILSIINEKDQYARFRLNQEMNPGKSFTKCVYGDENELNNIDPHKLFDIYKDIINNNPVDLFVVGDVDAENVSNIFRNKFNFNDRKALPEYIPESIVPSNIKNVTEAMNVNQGKLDIGFRTNILASNKDYFKLVVFNTIFGGSVNSKLFMNVREKASLCYHVASYVDKYNAQLFVVTGIDIQNRQKAYDIIREQLEAIKNNDISDSEFYSAINDIKSNNKAINDSAYSMILYYYSNMIAGLYVSRDEYISAIESVKKEDIPEIASRICEDTVYFLTNKEQEG